MLGKDSTLLRLMEGAGRRFIIPVYQRYYDWKKENCEQLYNDLLTVVREHKRSHFFGSIVSYSYRKDEIVLIDGQQRMTTISLILIAMINAMKEGKCVASSPFLAERIEEMYIIDTFREDERKVRLKPFRNDCNAFDKLIFGSKEDYVQDSKVTINYNYFYDRITQSQEMTMDELFDAITKLIIIDIDLEPERGDDPQLIFESLNSTGLDLTESDKIRNFILMGLEPSLQEQYYDHYWNKIEKCCKDDLDSFVRNFLTIATGTITTFKGVYPAFKAYAKSVNSIETVLQDMLKYAMAYEKIVSYNVGSPRANEIAKRLDLLDMTVAYPFLMAFLAYVETEKVPEEEVEKVLSCTEVFIFRRLICDLPTSALNKIFALLHKSILKNMKEEDTYSSVMIYLLQNRRQNNAFPRDEEFIQGFTTKNIYSMRAKNKEYIFERLENMSSKEKNDVVKNIEDGTLTIEHIMPQTLNAAWMAALGENYEQIQEKWLHTISNLTLSGYNYSYSNRPFQEKKTMKDGFAQSGLRLNQYIAGFEKWTEEELLKRQKKLSAMALEIWAYPESSFVPVQREDDIIYLSDDNNVPVGRKVSYFVFQGTRSDVPDWVEMIRNVVKILYNIDPTVLYREAADPDNVWFLTTPSGKFEKLAEGLYFCAGAHGTWTKMSILKNLFRKYGISEDDLFFGVLPEREEEVEPEKNRKQIHWLVSANEKFFKVSEWFKTHDYIYWSQTLNYQIGDKVYFYMCSPIQEVWYLCEVTEINVEHYNQEEEKPYTLSPDSLPSADFKYAKFKLVGTTEHRSALSLDHLRDHGLKSAPLRGVILNDALLEYIQHEF